jgi:hypothetical protein
LRVNLRGPAGNPTAIGARLTLELTDGSSQRSDVIAGAGWASQSSAAGFFGYPADNAPRLIRVRWPTGATTEHAVPAGSTSLTLEAPR